VGICLSQKAKGVTGDTFEYTPRKNGANGKRLPSVKFDILPPRLVADNDDVIKTYTDKKEGWCVEVNVTKGWIKSKTTGRWTRGSRNPVSGYYSYKDRTINNIVARLAYPEKLAELEKLAS